MKCPNCNMVLEKINDLSINREIFHCKNKCFCDSYGTKGLWDHLSDKSHKKPCRTNSRHGLTNTRLYNIWCGMKERCNNKNIPNYNYYGGRGIKVCSEWSNSFLSFYNWALSNGYKEDLTIDRIDVNDNYCPENCRWVNDKAQAINRRIPKNNTSGYRGIYKVKNKSSQERWAAHICVNYKSKILCWCKTQKEALNILNKYIIDNKLDYPIQEYKGEIGSVNN